MDNMSLSIAKTFSQCTYQSTQNDENNIEQPNDLEPNKDLIATTSRKIISISASSIRLDKLLTVQPSQPSLNAHGKEDLRRDVEAPETSNRACYTTLRTPIKTLKSNNFKFSDTVTTETHVSVIRNSLGLDIHNLSQLKEWLSQETIETTQPELSERSPAFKDAMYSSSNHPVSSLETAFSLEGLMASKSPHGQRYFRSTLCTQIPRESMAVLLDAVRGSTLEHDYKVRFLFDALDVNKDNVLSREGIEAFLDANMVSHGVQYLGQLEIRQIADKFFTTTILPNAMTFEEFKAAFGSWVQKGVHKDMRLGRFREANSHDQEHVRHLQQSLINKSCSLPEKKHQSRFGLQTRNSYEGAQCQKDQLLDGKNSQNQSASPRGNSDNHEGERGERSTITGLRKKTLRYRVRKWFRKYGPEIRFLTFYMGIMLLAFCIKFKHTPSDPVVHHTARVAKGFAQIVMVSTMFVLFPICRNLVTLIRQLKWVRRCVPVDQHISFHKLAGTVLLFAAAGHSVAWFIIIYQLRACSEQMWLQSRYSNLDFLRNEPLEELVLRLPIWTGLVMILLAMIAIPMTHRSVRQGKFFNAFWFTHLLLIPFILLVLVHNLARWIAPPQAFAWICFPCVLYFIEKRYRIANVFGGRTSILNVNIYRDTVALYIQKPRSFRKSRGFEPGMYLYLNIPAISRFEWHPFTISSAPDDETLSVHIHKVGDWTGALYDMMQKLKSQSQNPTSIASGNKLDHETHRMDITSDILSLYPSVYIDGPVGAPTQAYYQYNDLVFIGAGIGVTPFASILRTIVYQWEGYRCPNCKHVHFPKTFNIRKIYFYWITREQESLSWFRETMNQLSALDTENRLEIHNYFSPIKRESVIAPLRFVQTFIHETEGEDIISGLETKQMTHFGRPNWSQELARIAKQHHASKLNSVGSNDHEGMLESDIGVFFCGPRKLNGLLRDECLHYNQLHSKKTKVNFEYHSEIF
uniref:Respiratory burst oxidase putative n=1 Tax=Albugo laibachii Nc14 TaxID=890382 RepID=F0WDY2_9STRA|nr:respiratory burst oxidase putative [Albugo laibachii Nc14]|eukprot:CCA19410.1 respiratory burst oxidase putative [Albugo laibachii Nc14]